MWNTKKALKAGEVTVMQEEDGSAVWLDKVRSGTKDLVKTHFQVGIELLSYMWNTDAKQILGEIQT